MDEYTLELTKFDESNLNEMTTEEIEQAAKFQVEFYFGNTNYNKDFYLRNVLE